jgi:hypothetical protein
MLKRVFLSFAFVGALAAGGLGLTNKAGAHVCDDDYAYRYVYPTYTAYAPRVVYYPAPVRTYPVFYGRVYDGHHHHDGDHHDHHHDHHSGIHVSFGF